KLIALTDMAFRGQNVETEFDAVVKRHFDVIKGVMTETKADGIKGKINGLFDELLVVYKQVADSKELNQQTKDLIVSFGERISSVIIATVIEGAAYAYSPDFIKTNTAFGKHTLDIETTNALIRNYFPEKPVLTVCPGFITTDKESGIITNLGRGGSDYTAAILA